MLAVRRPTSTGGAGPTPAPPAHRRPAHFVTGETTRATEPAPAPAHRPTRRHFVTGETTLATASVPGPARAAGAAGRAGGAPAHHGQHVGRRASPVAASTKPARGPSTSRTGSGGRARSPRAPEPLQASGPLLLTAGEHGVHVHRRTVPTDGASPWTSTRVPRWGLHPHLQALHAPGHQRVVPPAPTDQVGVALTVADQAPVPAALNAATRNRWLTPLVRPVTVAAVEVDTPSAKVVQVAPPSLEYWTT